MVWFKVDDTLAFHAKVVAAGNAAIGLWTRAGSWSSQQLTEGFVPRHIAQSMGTRTEAKRLVDVNLWIEVEGGYQFWQWSDDGRQPTKAKVEADREASRKRQQAAREKAKSQRDERVTDAVTRPVTAGVTNGVVTASVTVPPTRPGPLTTEDQDLRGERREPLRPVGATDHPPDDGPRCSRHPNGNPTDQPCAGCARVREKRDQAEARDAERRALELEQARAGCPDCEGTGKVLDADKNPTAKRCTHPNVRRTA